MKIGRYGVESISIWCPECFEFAAAPDGSLQFIEADYLTVPAVMECGYCGEKFKRPNYPMQRDNVRTRARRAAAR
jgi:hypothetical protein